MVPRYVPNGNMVQAKNGIYVAGSDYDKLYETLTLFRSSAVDYLRMVEKGEITASEAEATLESIINLHFLSSTMAG